MDSRLVAILIAVLLLMLPGVPARAAALNEVIRALEGPFKEQRIQDYTADFSQEARIASLDRLQRARGRVSVRFDYRRGRSDQAPTVMFRWEYAEPTPQEIISDGKTLWVYLPENNQVIQSDTEMVAKASENDPMTLLTGLGNLSRDFSINWAEPNRDDKGNYVLDLRPHRPTALLNRMVIVVDRSAVEAPGAAAASRGGLVFPVVSTTVYDPSGNSTTIKFSNLRVNPGLSPGAFRFTPPAGVEVVRPTGKELGF